MKGIYRIAEKNIAVTTLFTTVHDLCKDYRMEGPVDFFVETTESDLDYERRKSEQENIKAGIPVRDFPADYFETLAVYRKIAEKMPEYNTFLFHGSCVAVDGAAYLFAAKSGTGKSTHTRLWRELFGDRAIMVNDDKPLIRVEEERVIVFGTPWDGKHRLSTNTAVPLEAVCILERGEKNVIEPVRGRDAYPALTQQIYCPSDLNAKKKTLMLSQRFVALVKIYRLRCNMDIEAAAVAYEGMRPHPGSI